MKAIQYLKLTALTLGLSAYGIEASAQDETDALRYSLIQPQGTARSMGFGSALGSVGGDFSTLSVNPAGIGIYRRSEFMFTPGITFNNTTGGYQTSSGYTGSSSDANGAHFSFNNVGIVWTSTAKGRRYDKTPWKAVSFGIGINRMADFTRDYNYGGTNTTSSGAFVFEDDANNGSQDVNSSNTPAYLGYQSYLIDTFTFTNGPGYLSSINPTSANPIKQNYSVKERGGISEVVLSLGGNYQEHLMLGATLGIPVVNYKRERTYTESNLNGASANTLNSFTYNENLQTTGLGINLKLGFIYKPNDYFRIGGAIHTPTYYGLTDVQDQSINTSTMQFGNVFVSAAQNQYDYSLTTPWRGVLSGTAMLGKYGFFTVDYEYVDYSSARFKFNNNAGDKAYQQYINDVIKSSYQGASNIRTGLEIKLDNLALRGGFGYYGNPYKSGVADGQHLDFSGGVGYRVGNMFLDLAFVHRMYKSVDQPYKLPSYYQDPAVSSYMPVVANLTNATNTAAMTVGWKF